MAFKPPSQDDLLFNRLLMSLQNHVRDISEDIIERFKEEFEGELRKAVSQYVMSLSDYVDIRRDEHNIKFTIEVRRENVPAR